MATKKNLKLKAPTSLDATEANEQTADLQESPPEASASLALPAVHADGSAWTDDEHDQAVAAYEQALDSGHPDAGRMRTVLSLHGVPGKPMHSGKDWGVKVPK